MTRTAWLDGARVETSELPAQHRGEVAPTRDPPPALLETIGAFGGRLPLWERHVARMHRSATRLGLPWRPPAAVREAAERLLDEHGDDVVRLTLAITGGAPSWALATRRRVSSTDPVRLVVAGARRPGDEGLGEHKTAWRGFYDDALAAARAAGGDDALLLGPGAEVRETAVANLIAGIGGGLWTPPAGGAVLPGIARGILLAAGIVRERVLVLEELAGAPLWTCNAVYGPRSARLGARAAPAAPGAAAALSAAWAVAVG